MPPKRLEDTRATNGVDKSKRRKLDSTANSSRPKGSILHEGMNENTFEADTRRSVIFDSLDLDLGDRLLTDPIHGPIVSVN